MDIIGKEIGNYRITTEINSGAYGSVYKAEHVHLKGRIVAIKLLHTYMGSTKERDQFVQEAQFLTVLSHPHILSLIDFGFIEGQPYLIAAYAAGGSLRDLLKQQALLPPNQVITILTQVGTALHYAHEQQIIHRDLKPENILFNAQGEALLADFGIATMLSTASVKHLTTIGGTPPYMAPEQFKGIVSKEGDQYALGCIAYELVTGHVPFTAPDFLSMGFMHLTEQPMRPIQHNPYLPATIEAAILRALAKQRADRHSDIPAFLAALQTSPIRATVQAKTSSVPATSSPLVAAVPQIPPTIPAASGQTKKQWIDTGDEYLDAKRYTEALDAYEQAIRLDPNYADAHYDKGIALHNLKRYEEALSAYEQVGLSSVPEIHLLQRVKDVLGALIGVKTRFSGTLESPDEQVIRLDPNDADAYNNTSTENQREQISTSQVARELSPFETAMLIADELGEDQESQKQRIFAIVRALGRTQARAFLQETLDIEASGGMMLPDGSRRRTPGGVFFYLTHTKGQPKEGRTLKGPTYKKPASKKQKAGASPAPTPKQEKQEPAITFTWEERIAVIRKAEVQKGTANVKITLVGRPGKIVDHSQCIVTVMESGKVPSLPRGLPIPPATATKYTVYIASKQWKKVVEAIKDPEDELIVEGFPTTDAQVSAIAVFATNVTTKKLQQAQKSKQAPTA